MRIIKILKFIISFLDLILALSFYSFVLILIISLFTFSIEPIEYVYSSTSNRTLQATIIGLITQTGISGFYFAVLNLKWVIKNLMRTKVFIVENTKFLNRSGIFTTAASTLLLITHFLEKYALAEEFARQDSSQLFLFIFTLTTGLSFIVISRILAESTKIKEENELTI